ncbi:MAG: polyprenyl synthetase family protein [Bacteroidales bacterium]|nr:polyprenyl synthetase family protein [Bacteroidales bacterium]MCI6046688.1 polyprenyl synthetase family protein [Alistipes sp.]MDY5200081.1 polyprenyl synthetase family protein [Candidatus Cryptobacteroides sp.]CCX51756.1 polyprenyl synthetase [Alistipes sp. CAG:514]
MTLDEIKDFLGQDWKDTDALIRSSLESDISLLNATNKAILDHSGKQLRPIVSLLVARACGGGRVNADSVRYAAAAELLHNATLLHDDVADSSCERRGAPTVMAILGGPASVLLGDFWLVKALENILASSANCNEVIRIFAGTLSSLAEGEMLQLQKASSGDTVEEDYYRIIYSKTASLFEAAFVSAAISVNAPADWIEAVRDYAVSLGIAFQIKDDIFDYSDGKKIGKPVGIDLEEQKITLPLLGALAAASPERAKQIRGMVLDILEHPEYKEEIVGFVKEGKGIEYAVSRLEDYVSKAVDALAVLPDSKEKDYLVKIAGFTAYRDK